MSLLLLFFVLLNTEYKDTEIFQPIFHNSVAVATDGRIYIFDRDETRVIVYDVDGKQIKTFGRKGQGPGEFNYVLGINMVDGKLYVIEFDGSSEFDLDGNFIKKYALGKMGNILYPSRSGWLSHEQGFDMETQSSKTEYKLLKKDLSELKTLGSFTKEMNMSGLGTKEMSMPMNPAESRPVASIDRTGSYVVYKGEKDFPITVYKVFPKVEKVFEINLTERKALPFNKDWGKEKIAEFEERTKSRGRGFSMKVTSDFPDFFPVVQGVTISPDNHIMVSLWTKAPEKPERLLYDWSGKTIANPFTLETLQRIIYTEGESAIVASYDEENEEYFLVKMPLAECKEYIAAHPYTEELDEVRMIMVQ